MFVDVVDECLERAEECRLEARRSIHREDALAWLALAVEWESLARATARDLRSEEPIEVDMKREAA